MKNFKINKSNILVKGFLLLSIITLTISYPSIITYSSYERYIQETLNLFSSAVDKISYDGMDLSKYDISIDKTEDNIKTSAILNNFQASKPILTREEFQGRMIGNTSVLLSNEKLEDTFQLDLNMDFSYIKGSGEAKKGKGSIKLYVENFNFTLGYYEELDIFEYKVKPDLEIQFKYHNFSIVNLTDDLKAVESDLAAEIQKNSTLQILEDLISQFIDRNIEKSFKNTENFSSFELKLKNKPNPVALSTTPLLMPKAQNNLNTNVGIKNYLDGKPYNLDGTQIDRINYNINFTSNEDNIFEKYIDSPRQVFITYETFADLIKVDFKKDSEITIYENDVSREIPFRFNVMYLNKFMPGLNYLYSNTQKFYVEIKVRDVTINQDENASYLIVKTDVFFKTAERNAGMNLLDISIDTKAYLDVEKKAPGVINVKFAEDIEILNIIPKSYASLEFYNDIFKDEFAKSFTITNLGVFDYQLFKFPISLDNLIGEWEEIWPSERGVLFVEKSQNENKSLSNRPERKTNKNNKRESLEFLK